MKINTISRLMSAASSVGQASESIMKQHIENTQSRLDHGVDIFGNEFAPYLDQERFRGRRPLSRAASLFDEARVDASTSSQGGVEFRAAIVGEAAKIAHYQNVKRRFLGYSDEDRRDMVIGIRKALKEGFKNGGH